MTCLKVVTIFIVSCRRETPLFNYLNRFLPIQTTCYFRPSLLLMCKKLSLIPLYTPFEPCVLSCDKTPLGRIHLPHCRPTSSRPYKPHRKTHTFTFPFGWLPIFQKKTPQASKLTIPVYKTPVYFTKIPPLEDVLCTLSALGT